MTVTSNSAWIVRIIEEQFHRDVEGRPLREGRTPPAFLRKDDIAWSRCPYSGSRHQHANPMNVSALRQTTAQWDALLDALTLLQQRYAMGRGGYGPDLRDLWYVSQLGSALPWFFILRDGSPPPAYAAALSKATLGTGILAQRGIVKMFGERWPPPPLNALTMVDLAEYSGTLVGATEVCAASEKMIAKFCEVLAPGAESDAAGGVSGLADRAESVLAFGSSYAAFKIVVWIYFLARRFLYVDAGLVQRLAEPVEPPDFFLLEPVDHKSVSPPMRAAWLRQLADLIVPFARGDASFRPLAYQFADAMACGGTPAEIWSQLDLLFGQVATLVESNFRGVPVVALDAEMRDRLIGNSPRALFGLI